MQISDALMYRYYELLTDLTLSEIDELKIQEPMSVKLALAERIVTDFHNADAARQAREDFRREVQEGSEPADVETVEAPAGARREDGSFSVVKLVLGLNLIESRTEAERKIKQGALEVNGQVFKEMVIRLPEGTTSLRLGKKWKRVKV
jgi:tyrosyl-tRNA synthetase